MKNGNNGMSDNSQDKKFGAQDAPLEGEENNAEQTDDSEDSASQTDGDARSLTMLFARHPYYSMSLGFLAGVTLGFCLGGNKRRYRSWFE